MGLPSTAVLEVRTGGAATNGGGFVTGAAGTDYSQQDTKNTGSSDKSVTDGVTAGTTTITSATANFGTTIVGNIIYVAGGTGAVAAGWYQVTARASATSITVDRSTGLTAGTGVTINIGGAIDSLATASSLLFNNSAGGPAALIYVKAGTYATTATFGIGSALWIIGYSTNRTLTNTDTKPLLQATASSFNIFQSTSTANIRNLSFDNNGQTSVKVWQTTAQLVYECSFTGAFADSGNGTAGTFHSCYFNVAGFHGAVFIDCEASGGGYINVDASSGLAVDCLLYGGGTMQLVSNARAVNCTNYGATGSGFTTGSGTQVLVNCYAENCGTWGFDFGTTTPGRVFTYNCGGYNNTSGLFHATYNSFNTLIPTGSVFVDPANNIFTLNNIQNRGALLRAAGYPTLFPRGLTANYRDVGAAQSRVPWPALTFGGGISG